ncbi:AraC-like DNA-binding protein [Pedobacter cryoconitis]|uniref:AraC-like DNA-binding protein n=1 Tax=Pedobacter cryoconitis TaxID=188932 RepID=A0A7W8ZJM3_9SPHI|nr:helix-turn-helix domain-containing protein [Pedobacter cryoconitis]MBB5635055.1 AraC-like DNA-binding protein [Pedobacter cryoconitis]
MYLTHTSNKTQGTLFFSHQEVSEISSFREKTEAGDFLTIALNLQENQQVIINGVAYVFPQFSIIPLVANQVFKFERAEQITIWHYTRDFYCLVDNNFELSCLGLLFSGFSGNLFLKLDENYVKKLELLLQMFMEEFKTRDTIQTDMLQILVKHLVIITTRLAKEQYLSDKVYEEDKFDLIRQFNLLVEYHYKKEHQVQFYAGLLNKSPKTLSNVFAHFNYSTPSEIIQGRIITEAKRLFLYTNKSSKEIAYELGFSDAGHFSRFFKNATKQNPSELRKSQSL